MFFGCLNEKTHKNTFFTKLVLDERVCGA